MCEVNFLVAIYYVIEVIGNSNGKQAQVNRKNKLEVNGKRKQ